MFLLHLIHLLRAKKVDGWSEGCAARGVTSNVGPGLKSYLTAIASMWIWKQTRLTWMWIPIPLLGPKVDGWLEGCEARRVTSRVEKLLDRNCRFQPTLSSLSFCLDHHKRWMEEDNWEGEEEEEDNGEDDDIASLTQTS